MDTLVCFFLSNPININKKNFIRKIDVFDELLMLLEKENFNKDHLNGVLKEFANGRQLKYTKLMKDLRTILSGLQVSKRETHIVIVEFT